jgi:RNA-directed DNA polymerase
MLRFKTIPEFASAVGLSGKQLGVVADEAEADRCFQELWLLDPAKPQKIRSVLNVVGDLREVQRRLLDRIFLKRLTISDTSYGSVRGRSIKKNALAHSHSTHVFTADIADFYPTICNDRVYAMLVRLGCSPDVARLCTRLCTREYHLALGLITSPILAEHALSAVDGRITAACKTAGLIYTRYVDDVTISGPFDFDDSGFRSIVGSILNEHGFAMHKVKTGRMGEEVPITKIVVRNGTLDVQRAYLDELIRQIKDLKSLGYGGSFRGPYFTRGQVLGRVYFVSWINPRRRKSLMSLVETVPWERVEREARRRRLVKCMKRVINRDQLARLRPDMVVLPQSTD